MKQAVIDQMQKIVDETMTSFQSDFEKDLQQLMGYNGKFIWQVAPSHTHLHLCSKQYLDELLEHEPTLYAYCQNSTWAGACLANKWTGEKIYSYDDSKDVFSEISREEAIRRWNICKNAALNRWQIYHMETLPTDFKVRIEFRFPEVKQYFMEQVRYASQHNDTSLLDCLRRFRHYMKRGAAHKIVISRDFTDRSFQFLEDYGNGKYGLNGGIIFHGYPEEGYKENCSVQLTPSYGWQIHT